MPHERLRHLSRIIKHLSTYSPLIGVLGHRQVGKTTLMERVSNEYVSFDDEAQLKRANDDPAGFLAGFKRVGCAIDECQLTEKIFPALKERVRKDKRPGQFMLSGSVRFTSKKLIRESLTGRIVSLDLLPLTLSELDETDLPDHLKRLQTAANLAQVFSKPLPQSEFKRRAKLIEQYQFQGGLPGACFTRNEKLRSQHIISQLETILDRDLRQIVPTTLVQPELMRFLRTIALQDGGMLQHQQLRRETNISPVTQKRLLFALESVFVLRTVPLEGDFRGNATWFEDQGEAHVLSQGNLSNDQRWSGLVYRNIREQTMYQLGSNAVFFQYRTRGGVIVPIASRTTEGNLGIVPAFGPLTRRHVAAAQSFLRKYDRAKVIIVGAENELREIEERIWAIPAAQLLFE